MKDNPLYEYSQVKSTMDADFIYFDDEPEKKEDMSDSITGARIIITLLLEASGGNTVKLQALMGIFSGNSLRQAGELCSRSHEWIRLQLLSIKKTHPELYVVLTDKNRFQVTSLIPIGKSKKWEVTDVKTGKTIYADNLLDYCKKNNLSYYQLLHNKDKYKVNSMIPMSGEKKWEVYDKESDTSEYVTNLLKYCRDKNLEYHKIIYRIRYSGGVYGKYKFTKI